MRPSVSPGENRNAGNSRVLPIAFTACAAAVVALHAWAAFFPTGLNWGFHHLGFLPGGLRAVLLLLMAACLIPSFPASAAHLAAGAAARFRGSGLLQRKAAAGGALLILALLFWAGRENLFLLGDGNLLVRTLPSVTEAKQIALTNSWNGPLAALIILGVRNALAATGAGGHTAAAFQLVSVVFGAGTVTLLFRIARLAAKGDADTPLLALFLLGSGASQMFFGYVENYSPVLFGLAVFLLLGALYAAERVSILAPALAFSSLFLFHFGTVVLAPSLLYLLVLAVRRGEIRAALLACLAGSALVAGVLAVCGYTPEVFADHLAAGASQMVPLHAAEGRFAPYTMFSLFHFVDVANLLMLLSPLAPAAAVLCLAFAGGRRMLTDRRSAFFLLSAACGFGFVFLMRSGLGMSRDWDLFSLFAFPGVVLAGFLLQTGGLDQVLRSRAMALLAGVSLLHTAGWVSLNSTHDAALDRFVALQDPKLWAQDALANAYDEMAIYYRGRNDVRHNLEFYLKYLDLDSTNPRILVNAGVAYGQLGSPEEKTVYFLKAIRHGIREPSIYLDVATRMYETRRFDEAFAVARRGLEIDSTLPLLNNQYGALLVERDTNYSEALAYFRRALRYDPSFAKAYSNAAICCYRTGRTLEMIPYLKKYVQLAPADPLAGRFRQMIAQHEPPASHESARH